MNRGIGARPAVCALVLSSIATLGGARAFAADASPSGPVQQAPSPPAPAGSAPVDSLPPPGPPKWRAPSAPQAHGDEVDYFTRRYEPAGFPLIGGDSDIGFEFGAVGYAVVLLGRGEAVPLEHGPAPVGEPQARARRARDRAAELPLADRRARPVRRRAAAEPGGLVQPHRQLRVLRPGQRLERGAAAGLQPQSRALLRVDRFVRPGALGRASCTCAARSSAEIAAQYLYVGAAGSTPPAASRRTPPPATRTGRRLSTRTTRAESSVACGRLRRTTRATTRSSRTAGCSTSWACASSRAFPSVRTSATPRSARILRGFVPLVGPLVLAGRLVGNPQMGNVPFFDLFQAGPFDQKEMPGGSAGDPRGAGGPLPRADQGGGEHRAPRHAHGVHGPRGRSSPSATTPSSTPDASGATTRFIRRSTGAGSD